MEPSMPARLCPWWILDYRIYDHSKVFHTMGSELACAATELDPWTWIWLSICQSRVVLTGFLHNHKVSEIWSHQIRAQTPLDQTGAVAIDANMSFYHDHKAILDSVFPRHLCNGLRPWDQVHKVSWRLQNDNTSKTAEVASPLHWGNYDSVKNLPWFQLLLGRVSRWFLKGVCRRKNYYSHLSRILSAQELHTLVTIPITHANWVPLSPKTHSISSCNRTRYKSRPWSFKHCSSVDEAP